MFKIAVETIHQYVYVHSHVFAKKNPICDEIQGIGIPKFCPKIIMACYLKEFMPTKVIYWVEMASMYLGTILLYFYELRRQKYFTIFGQKLETLAMVWWVVQ